MKYVQKSKTDETELTLPEYSLALTTKTSMLVTRNAWDVRYKLRIYIDS